MRSERGFHIVLLVIYVYFIMCENNLEMPDLRILVTNLLHHSSLGLHSTFFPFSFPLSFKIFYASNSPSVVTFSTGRGKIIPRLISCSVQ